MAGSLGLARLAKQPLVARAPSAVLFTISLAEWSLHKTLFGGDMDNLGFIKAAKNDYGIDGVEYVNSFFKDKAKDQAYLTEMNTTTDGEGVTSLLIMCDGEGQLGDPDPQKRTQAVENHQKWVEAPQFLGCH